MKAKVFHIKDMKFLGISNNHSIVLDDGKDAMAPMQALLVAMATCSAMDVWNIMKKKRQKLEDLEIEIEGERADKYPKIFTKIKVTYVFKGEVEEKACKDAIELSLRKYCSIANMLNKSAEIEYEFIMK